MSKAYTFQPYDVLQIESENRPGTWLDYATLRNNEDAEYAVQAVDNRSHSGRSASFRIVRNSKPVYIHVPLPLPSYTINVLIVTPDASYVAFQASSWKEAAQIIERYLDDPFYSKRIQRHSPVFMANVGDPSSVREQHEAWQIVQSLKSGELEGR